MIQLPFNVLQSKVILLTLHYNNSGNTINAIRLWWVKHVAHEKLKTAYKILVKTPKQSDHFVGLAQMVG